MYALTFQIESRRSSDVLDRYNARLNIFGRKELLYEFTRVQGEEAERLTQGNGR
jgi:hypothetical protein